MLIEELDFVREARLADLYRITVRHTNDLEFLSVPKVFFEMSNDDVIVSEFVTGIWMKDLLPAFETDSIEIRQQLDDLRLDRITLARRIQKIARFNNFENFFFHADLHPGNILVQANNRIALIDFGSCGAFSKSELVSWRRWFDAQSTDDVGGMVQAALGILEPLPPIDKDNFGLRMQYMFWEDLCAIKSKHSNWSERSAAHLWIGFLKLSREFQVPLRLNLLRMIRASMLTDTIALRLDPLQDPYREFRRYEKEAGWRAKRRLWKRARQLCGPSKFVRIEQGLSSVFKLVYQVERTVDSLASIRYAPIIGRLEYFISLLLRTTVWAAVSAGGLVGIILLGRLLHIPLLANLLGTVTNSGSLTLWQIPLAVLRSNLWQALVIVPTLLSIYRVSFRLRERRPL
jgi:predicted unusual protein kinase regulating ubiquinone biosynthesis (AarF/ABC1/UbiB family)